VALNLVPYFESLGVPSSVLRRDERGNVIGVGDMAIIPQQAQPLANRATIAQAIETLRQALPSPVEGIQATLGAIREVAPQLGEIAQQLPTTLAARNIAATLTGMLPTGQPTEARRQAMAMEALQRASIAAQQQANALRAQAQRIAEAQALANALPGVAAPGQAITLTPEQRAALGPFADIFEGATIPATAEGFSPPPSLVSLYNSLVSQLNTLRDRFATSGMDEEEVEAERQRIMNQMRALEPFLFPTLPGAEQAAIDPQQVVNQLRAAGVSDSEIAEALRQDGYDPAQFGIVEGSSQRQQRYSLTNPPPMNVRVQAAQERVQQMLRSRGLGR